MADIPDGRILDALDHVDRNGSLAWVDAPTPAVTELYGELQGKGYIARNPWSDRFEVTDAGKVARARSREIDELLGEPARPNPDRWL